MRLPCSYMLRAYQSPYSGADSGPQCAQIPNLASRNQSGTRYSCRLSRVALNGPGAITGASWACIKRAVNAAAGSVRSASLLVIDMGPFLFHEHIEYVT